MPSTGLTGQPGTALAATTCPGNTRASGHPTPACTTREKAFRSDRDPLRWKHVLTSEMLEELFAENRSGGALPSLGPWTRGTLSQPHVSAFWGRGLEQHWVLHLRSLGRQQSPPPPRETGLLGLQSPSPPHSGSALPGWMPPPPPTGTPRRRFLSSQPSPHSMSPSLNLPLHPRTRFLDSSLGRLLL